MRRRRVLVVGGGCYGRHFVERLRRARAQTGDVFDIWVVDRNRNCLVTEAWLDSAFSAAPGPAPPGGPEDRLVAQEWADFLCAYLDPHGPDAGEVRRDLLVPSPVAPHLFANWLKTQLPGAACEAAAFDALPELPYAARLESGGLAISHAAWRCPVHCVEPRLCPATRQRRDWDLARSLLGYARRLRAQAREPLVGPLVSQCVAWRHGVGVVALADWLGAAGRLRRQLPRGGLALAATVSACHGLAHLLRFTPGTEPTTPARGQRVGP